MKAENMKCRKVSFGVKLLIPTCLVFIALSVVICFFSYSSTKEKMIKMGAEQAVVAGKIAAASVDPNLVQLIDENSNESEEYNTIVSGLRIARDQCGIMYVYTLYCDGNTVYYGVDADETEDHCEAGLEFETPYEELAPAFAGEIISTDYIDHQDYGDVISVYIPIKDSTGKTVAVLGSDYNAAEISENVAASLRSLISIVVAGILASIVLLFITNKLLLRNLSVVNRKIYDIANTDGDLTSQLDIKTGDEFELIADNVNTLISYIRDVMLVIKDNALTLGDNTTDINSSIEKVDNSVQDISATMEEMSASMEETSATLNQIDGEVHSIVELINSVSEETNKENSHSKETIRRVSELKENFEKASESQNAQVEEIVNTVTEKIESAKKVEEISTMATEIVSIAEETSLLSLNASIEAARAGEMGKGFAVVAEAIGSLATNSSNAAERIEVITKEVITSVEELSNEATRMIDFMKKVSENSKLQSDEITDKYKADIESVSETMSNFSESCKNMNENIRAIKESINAINSAVEENARGVTIVAEAAVSLAEDVKTVNTQSENVSNSSTELSNQVNKFKVE